jgi:hypothetical protein
VHYRLNYEKYLVHMSCRAKLARLFDSRENSSGVGRSSEYLHVNQLSQKYGRANALSIGLTQRYNQRKDVLPDLIRTRGTSTIRDTKN